MYFMALNYSKNKHSYFWLMVAETWNMWGMGKTSTSKFYRGFLFDFRNFHKKTDGNLKLSCKY